MTHMWRLADINAPSMELEQTQHVSTRHTNCAISSGSIWSSRLYTRQNKILYTLMIYDDVHCG